MFSVQVVRTEAVVRRHQKMRESIGVGREELLLHGSVRELLLMEDEDRDLIERLKATNDATSHHLADSMLKAYESPQEVLKIFEELRPILGEKSFQSIDEMLQVARRIARGLLADRESSSKNPLSPKS